MILSLLAGPASTPTGPEFGKASPLGLVIILILLAGTVLLVRSMNKHLKKLPATFEPEHPEADQAADEGTEPGIVRLESESAEVSEAASDSAKSSPADKA